MLNIEQRKSDLRFEEIMDLPEDLREELSFSRADKLEMTICTILREFNGVASIDRLLVELYRKTNAVYKRIALTTKIHRMIKKGKLFSVPQRRGYYSLFEVN